MTDLSPAAQAVLDAVDRQLDKDASSRPVVAAALRAAVWQCVYMDDYGTDLVNAEELRAIAIELEANR
jgi:hypothetical protein